MFGEGLRPLAEEFCHQMQMVGTAGAEKPVPSRCLSAGKPISGNNEPFFGIHLSDHSSMCEGSILTKTPCGFSGSVDLCQRGYITWNNGPLSHSSLANNLNEHYLYIYSSIRIIREIWRPICWKNEPFPRDQTPPHKHSHIELIVPVTQNVNGLI